MLTIGISISNHFVVPWKFVQGIVRFISQFPENKIFHAHGSLIHENRNWLLEKCSTDMLLMIDTDIVFVPEDVLQLIATMRTTGADVVTGLYKEGYTPHQWAIFDDKLGHPIELPDKPFEIGACGMGFCLINKKALVGKMREKPFDPITDNDVRHGEDVSFCLRVKKLGFKIVCDPNVRVGHLRLQEL